MLAKTTCASKTKASFTLLYNTREGEHRNLIEPSRRQALLTTDTIHQISNNNNKNKK